MDSSAIDSSDRAGGPYNPHPLLDGWLWAFSSVQSFSHVWLFANPWIVAHQASLSLTNSGVYSNVCPSSWWWHPNISSSVIPFSSCLQSFPTSRSFPVSQFFTSGGQSIGTSASVLPMNIQYWFPLIQCSECYQIIYIRKLNHIWLFETPWTM